MKNIIIGLMIGLGIPFAMDYVLFADATPCETVKRYEDGSSVQHCSVRG